MLIVLRLPADRIPPPPVTGADLLADLLVRCPCLGTDGAALLHQHAASAPPSPPGESDD